MFASISHELRTPLNSILNSNSFITAGVNQVLEIMENDYINSSDLKWSIMKDTCTIKKFSKILNSSTLMLNLIVEDILDMSKFEAGIFKSNLREFKIWTLIEEIKEIFEDQCKQKHIEFFWGIEDEIKDAKILSDGHKIKQVLMNIISNSFKFTFHGSISVSVSEIVSENSSFAEFWVSDTGIGIKLEDQSKLFKLFEMRSDNELNPNGTGIGLTVSKKYIENLGGKIWLISKFGQGTIVTFTIPLVFNLNQNQQDERGEFRIEWKSNMSDLQRLEFNRIYESYRQFIP